MKRQVAPSLEEQLIRALAIPKMVISISGPSKSGKSVLIEGIVGIDNLIIVSGSEIKSPNDLWEHVLDWMGAPTSSSTATSSSSAAQASSQLAGAAALPLGVVKGSITAGTQSTDTRGTGVTTTQGRQGLSQVATEIADSSFCILVDDFHYIDANVQVEIGKQIKTASERGIRILTASVPHRSDDVVRSNSELRGRTISVDTVFWEINELEQIAETGFEVLNVEIPREVIRELAVDACGSPQLMQRICLQVCSNLRITQESDLPRIVSSAEIDLKEVMSVTSTISDYKTMLQNMHGGPKTRGTERKEFDLIDGSKGDVYRCILMGIARDPPAMGLPYPMLMERIKQVCIGEAPVGRSVTEACVQISTLAKDRREVEFDTDSDVETFYVTDPYWLFYLRSSPKMFEMAKSWRKPQPGAIASPSRP